MTSFPSAQQFRLTASAIASHFKHRCPRRFRWNAVEGRERGKAGIGWNVPARVRRHSRPGIALLMQAGDSFEVDQVRALLDECGADQLYHAGIVDGEVQALTLHDALTRCLQPQPPRYIAQVTIDLHATPAWEHSFLVQFGLDPQRVKLGPARPDLLELVAPVDGREPLLRVWDFKASQAARHEHFMQVAYYSLLLEHALACAEVTGVAVDTAGAVVRSRQGREAFELAPYRLAVDDFLRNQVPQLLAVPAADAHFHVHEACLLCEYMDHCRHEADASSDLSRVAYITSPSKRRLRAAGIATHRELGRITAAGEQQGRLDALHAASQDLSVNLQRYIAAAQALEDGVPRPLEATTLLMPRYEHVRVVLSAEQDAVTGTCFALGIKTYEGWDAATGKVRGDEHVFVATKRDDEVALLVLFLQTLNALLRRVDEENRAVRAQPIAADSAVAQAEQALAAAEQALHDFNAMHGVLRKRDAATDALRVQRDQLKAGLKQAKQTLRDQQRVAEAERWRALQRLHFYVYDQLDLLILKGLIERHLFASEPPELLHELATLIRLFPPESVLPDADTFRTVPVTTVVQVLRTLVALPVPYLYDLKTVSQLYQPRDADGNERGTTFAPRYGFGWEHSNQVAFERIHDVWHNRAFVAEGRRPARFEPPAIIAQIEQTVRSKLRATDGIVRRLKQDFGERLLLRKEPFQLYDGCDPLDIRVLEALRVFTLLEASVAELQLKTLHTLPPADRAAKFESMRGLRYLADGPDDALWFTFDPACRDSKFEVGDFNLVVTPEDDPLRLLGEIDGELFNPSRWRHAPYEVTLEAYDTQADPPRVLLKPKQPAKFREKLDLDRVCVLDRLYVDHSSAKVQAVLHALQASPEGARHIHELLATATVAGWQPFVAQSDALAEALRALIVQSGGDAARALNAGQWRAWHGVLCAPLSLLWGPPGTGKTHTVAHMLLGYALAARRAGQQLRVLVTAFTHHAIANVLHKVAELAARYQLDASALRVAKLVGFGAHTADEALPPSVERIGDEQMAGLLGDEASCVVVGSTVWGVYRALDKSGALVQPWFDVVLVDEASQLKLPDALIALSASKPTASIILAGDDRQLPPIIHGSYPDEQAHLLSSVFAFVRHRVAEQRARRPELEQRVLFQLDENFRMNAPLTNYPRDVLYGGQFRSTKPDIRIRTVTPLDAATQDLIDCVLHPDRPVVLCTYTSPRPFTARNPFEAEIVAQIAARLRDLLVDDVTGERYQPVALGQRGLAILAPHRAQNSTIRQLLAQHGFGGAAQPLPLVDTVDKLQGQERDVVLVSYGVADDEYAEGEADFLLSSNRFNVAATRARHKLVVFCSDAVLGIVPNEQQVLLDAQMLKEFRRYCDSGAREVVWPSLACGEVVLRVQWKGFEGGCGAP
jgi:hypothetical protein